MAQVPSLGGCTKLVSARESGKATESDAATSEPSLLETAGAVPADCAKEEPSGEVAPDDDVSEEVGAAQAATSRANVAPNAAQRQRLPIPRILGVSAGPMLDAPNVGLRLPTITFLAQGTT